MDCIDSFVEFLTRVLSNIFFDCHWGRKPYTNHRSVGNCLRIDTALHFSSPIRYLVQTAKAAFM